jgi:alkylated DNA repair protein (DNA oxidative demethylase)
LNGLKYFPGYFSRSEQEKLVRALRSILEKAPLFTPRMPKTDKPFSVRMSNCGELGWVSDIKGYRYQARHPETKKAWPAMPQKLLQLWEKLADYPHPPQACLINWYAPGTKMGLHQDKDEQDFSAPVLSISLGDTALFRVGGLKRKDRTRSFELKSGDVVMLAGKSRLAFHGIDRIYSETSNLLEKPGRINLTLRRVTKSG